MIERGNQGKEVMERKCRIKTNLKPCPSQYFMIGSLKPGRLSANSICKRVVSKMNEQMA